jgi:hypothetical protein
MLATLAKGAAQKSQLAASVTPSQATTKQAQAATKTAKQCW